MPSDEDLAVRAQEEKLLGRTTSFEELVVRLERPLYGFLVVRVGNSAEAEELVQEAFLRAWNKIDRFDPHYRFSTWLFTIAKRLAVSRARVRKPDGLPEEALYSLADETEKVLAALAKAKEPVELVYLEGQEPFDVRRRAAFQKVRTRVQELLRLFQRRSESLAPGRLRFRNQNLLTDRQ